MSECLFCNEHNNNENTFAENDYWRARWDSLPLTPGHAEVVAKRHVQYLEQLNDDELTSMMKFARDVMRTIKDTDLEALYHSLLQSNQDERFQDYQKRALAAVAVRPGVPDAFNLGINDGPLAGQSVPHLHLHIIPRWDGDVENPRGGVRNMFGPDEYSKSAT